MAIDTGDVPAFEQLHNFRDVGGSYTRQGGRLRTGLLFRSGQIHRATARDLAQLQSLNIKLICDLRSPHESARKQPRQLWAPEPRLVNVPLHDPAVHDGQRRKLLGFLWGEIGASRFRAFFRDYYRHLVFEQAARIGEVVTLLASPENQPALLHCTAGKDRTGLVVAFIQLLLDVPFATVHADYLRTNDDTGPRLERLLRTLRLATLAPALSQRLQLISTTHPEHLTEIHEQVISAHGSVEKYLRELCGISCSTVNQLRRALLGAGSSTPLS